MGRKPLNPNQKQIRADFSLNPQTVERLNQTAARIGRKKSQIVEEAITEKLDKLDSEDQR